MVINNNNNSNNRIINNNNSNNKSNNNNSNNNNSNPKSSTNKHNKDNSRTGQVKVNSDKHNKDPDKSLFMQQSRHRLLFREWFNIEPIKHKRTKRDTMQNNRVTFLSKSSTIRDSGEVEKWNSNSEIV